MECAPLCPAALDLPGDRDQRGSDVGGGSGTTALVRYDALTRWYARLETGPGYEVWLLSWLPGQSSGFHDHGDSSGVMTVVQGELVERSLVHGGEGLRALRPGGQRVFSSGYLHEVVNAALEPAVSIHLYSPGLTEMNQYGAVAAQLQPGLS